MKIIDIGCGRKKLAGSIGLDCSPFSTADIVLDLNVDPLPFEDDTIDFVHSSHALEHLTWSGFLHIISEIYRVCKQGGQIFIAVPYYQSSANLANPFHNNQLCFNEHTFRFFSSAAETKAMSPLEYATPSCPQWGLRYSANEELGVELELLKIDFVYYPEFEALNSEERFARRRQDLNVVDGVHYWLRPIKPCPQTIRKESLCLEDLHEYIEKQVVYARSQMDWLEKHHRAGIPEEAASHSWWSKTVG